MQLRPFFSKGPLRPVLYIVEQPGYCFTLCHRQLWQFSGDAVEHPDAGRDEQREKQAAECKSRSVTSSLIWAFGQPISFEGAASVITTLVAEPEQGLSCESGNTEQPSSWDFGWSLTA